MSIGIPAASLCINRRLYRVASCICAVSASKADKRRAIMVDLAIGVGLPVLVMTLRMLLGLYFLRRNTFPDEDLQTTSSKAIDSTFSRTLDAPLPLITLGLYFPSSTCRL